MQKIDSDSYFFRNLNICSYTNINAPNHPLLKGILDGTCDSKCWKDFSLSSTSYERKTPCNGDRGTSLMVEEGGIMNEDRTWTERYKRSPILQLILCAKSFK